MMVEDATAELERFAEFVNTTDLRNVEAGMTGDGRIALSFNDDEAIFVFDMDVARLFADLLSSGGLEKYAAQIRDAIAWASQIPDARVAN